MVGVISEKGKRFACPWDTLKVAGRCSGSGGAQSEGGSSDLKQEEKTE